MFTAPCDFTGPIDIILYLLLLSSYLVYTEYIVNYSIVGPVFYLVCIIYSNCLHSLSSGAHCTTALSS